MCLFILDSTYEIYIPSDNYEASFQMYTHVFSLKVKMVEILTDLNENEAVKHPAIRSQSPVFILYRF